MKWLRIYSLPFNKNYSMFVLNELNLLEVICIWNKNRQLVRTDKVEFCPLIKWQRNKTASALLFMPAEPTFLNSFQLLVVRNLPMEVDSYVWIKQNSDYIECDVLNQILPKTEFQWYAYYIAFLIPLTIGMNTHPILGHGFFFKKVSANYKM